MRTWRHYLGVTIALLAISPGAHAQDTGAPGPARQSLEDAWWTGPMLTPSAATLPRGHVLIEPYLFDNMARGRFDADGVRRRAGRAHTFGSLTYILFGVTDRITAGLIPVAGHTTVSGGPSSSGIRLGDVTLHAHYGLTTFSRGRRTPATALVVEQRLPTGQHDRLGERPSNGFGSGDYRTSVALFSQTYFWLPTGRILRTRVNASYARSSGVKIQDVSVYGTETGFRGDAHPGDVFSLLGGWEYSLTRRWVVALDAVYERQGSTRVSGSYLSEAGASRGASDLHLDSGTSQAFMLAPAVEYNWTSRVGVLVGVRIIPAGRNTTASITPAVAINIVH